MEFDLADLIDGWLDLFRSAESEKKFEETRTRYFLLGAIQWGQH